MTTQDIFEQRGAELLAEAERIEQKLADEAASLVPCPGCAGSGYRDLVSESLWGRGRPKTARVRCLACRQHPGKVEAERVCRACGEFKDLCRCKVNHHERVFKRAPRQPGVESGNGHRPVPEHSELPEAPPPRQLPDPSLLLVHPASGASARRASCGCGTAACGTANGVGIVRREER